MRERLIRLLKQAYDEYVIDEISGCREELADYLLANGVVALVRDGNDFNPDLYCPYCGNNLSAAGMFGKDEEE